MTKTTFFSFIFPIPLSHTSWLSFSIVLSGKHATHARPCCDPILDVTLEMGNLSFTQRNLVNFFVKNLHFFFIEYLFQIYCILSSERSSNCSSTWFAAVLDMSSQTCGNLSPGVFVFVVRPDQEEIGIIVALEIGVRMDLFLEEM